MSDISVTVLYSGSSGNGALVSCGGEHLLIDAGRSARALCNALKTVGVTPGELSAILLTHEHRDHTAALEQFLSKHPMPVHAPAPSAEVLLRTATEPLAAALVPHPPLATLQIGGFTVTSFPTSHDSHGSVGYRIRHENSDTALGYATDLGIVSAEVKSGLLGCGTVVLESNYDEEMLETGPYPPDLKRRIASRKGHLSNADCAAFAVCLAQNGMRNMILAHLSEHNNLPELALGETEAALAGLSVALLAASPLSPVGFERRTSCSGSN